MYRPVRDSTLVIFYKLKCFKNHWCVMLKSLFYHICYLFLSAILLTLVVSCMHSQKVIGRWSEIGKTSTLEFMNDGSFRAVDNMGMIVNGNYFIEDNGDATFEIIQPEGTIEIINVKITIKGDEMTIKFINTNEVEKYRKEK